MVSLSSSLKCWQSCCQWTVVISQIIWMKPDFSSFPLTTPISKHPQISRSSSWISVVNVDCHWMPNCRNFLLWFIKPDQIRATACWSNAGRDSHKHHGFLKGLSCETLLMNRMDKSVAAIDRSNYVLLVLLDLRKAFNSVDHFLLLDKIQRMGFGSSARKSIKPCLFVHAQGTEGRGMASPGTVRCDVPHGSVLGPATAFLIFVNFLLELPLRSKIRSYADDRTRFTIRSTKLRRSDDWWSPIKFTNG